MTRRVSARQLAESLSVDRLKEIRDAQPECDARKWAVSGCAYPVDDPMIYIKYGGNRSKGRDAEARTQKWAVETLQQLPPNEREGICIPEVYRIVYLDTWTIILMEYVPGKTLSDLLADQATSMDDRKRFLDKMEQAFRLLLSLPVPEGMSPGPYGGGVIRHPLFKEYKSAIEYPTVDMLEKHLNKIATWFDSDAPRVKLERKLHLVKSDLYEGNFIFTEKGDLYIIDFEQANFLPLSFMTYAMIQGRWAGQVKDGLELPEENLQVMREVGSLFVMGIPKLGNG